MESVLDAHRAHDVASQVLRQVSELARARDVVELAERTLAAVTVPHSASSFDLTQSTGDRGRTLAASGVSDYFLTRYEQVGRQDDPVLEQAIAMRRTTDDRSVVSPASWTSLPVYENVFRLHRLTHVLYAPILVDDEVVATLDIGRGDAHGPFSEPEIEHVQALADVVAVAYESLARRHRLVKERDQIAAALDLCDEPVVITDARSGHRRLNVAARRLLARLAAGSAGLDDVLPATRSHVRAALHETTVDLGDGTRAQLRCRSAALDDDPDVVVSFPRLVTTSVAIPAVIRAGLTPRETDVVGLVVDGLRDAEIARTLGVSEHTVKQHLKTVYRKLGVRSRVALVRAVL